MIVKLLAEHHFELKGGCRGSSDSLHMPKYHIVGILMHWLIFDS